MVFAIGWYVKRNVQKGADLSDYTQAEFLNFSVYFSFPK